MFTIQKAFTDVHSLVSEEFNGFIETRVKEAIKSEKDAFMESVKLCEEDYPIYQKKNEFTQELFELIKEIWIKKMQHYKYYHVETHMFKYTLQTVEKDGLSGDDYRKFCEELFKYKNKFTQYPMKIMGNDLFIQPIKTPSKTPSKTPNWFCYGIDNKGIVYKNVSIVNPDTFLRFSNDKDIEHVIINTNTNISHDTISPIAISETTKYEDCLRVYNNNLSRQSKNASNRTRHGDKPVEITVYPTNVYQNINSRHIEIRGICDKPNMELYDISKYIKLGSCKIPVICVNNKSGNGRVLHYETHSEDEKKLIKIIHGGCGCQRGIFLRKESQKVNIKRGCENYEELKIEYQGLINDRVKRKGNLKRLHELRDMLKKADEMVKHEKVKYYYEGDALTHALNRYINGDICPECGAGSPLGDIDKFSIDPKAINRTPLNKEYMELLNIVEPENIETIFKFQTIYAKYHPRANERHTIEQNILKLSKLEEEVVIRTEEAKNEYKNEIEKCKIIQDDFKRRGEEYGTEKKKYIKLQKSIEYEKKEFQKKKNALSEMTKQTNETCRKNKQKIQKQLDDIIQEKQKFNDDIIQEKQKFNDDKKTIIDNLLKLAIDLNGINDSLNDPESKSDELFEIIQRLSEMK